MILVEGLFDLAVLWQSAFRNTTCALGAHLTPAQFDQLSDPPGRSVYIVLDQDENQAGQQAAQQLAHSLENAAVAARIVHLPSGHDPNSYFLARATAADFAARLQGAQRLKLSLLYRPSVPASACPYRLLDEQDQEIPWANTFLDAQRVRQLSLRSLRAYAYDLLHFARWACQRSRHRRHDLCLT